MSLLIDEDTQDLPLSTHYRELMLGTLGMDELLQATRNATRYEFLKAIDQLDKMRIIGPKAVELLVEASKRDEPFYVTEIINAGIDPNSQDGHGNTALFLTQKAGSIHALIRTGADPWLKNSGGELAALQWKPGDYTSRSVADRVRHFNEAIAKHTTYGRVWSAINQGHRPNENDIAFGALPMRWVAEDGTITTKYPLTFAINLLGQSVNDYTERMNVVQMLLDAGSEVNSHDDVKGDMTVGFCTTPLGAAIMYAGKHPRGNTALVSRLLEMNADPNATASLRKPQKVRQYATVALVGCLENGLERAPGILKLLLDAGARVDVPIEISGHACDILLAISIASGGLILERGPLRELTTLLLNSGCPVNLRMLDTAFPKFQYNAGDRRNMLIQLVNQHNSNRAKALMS